MIYLDNSATTKTCEKAAQTALHYMQEEFYNPAALYDSAIEVEKNVEDARENFAKSMGVSTKEIIFTSGGTESNNIAIMGTLSMLRPGKWKFITSQIEHPSVFKLFKTIESQGHEVVYIGVDKFGTIDYAQLEKEVNAKTVLVSIMHVNNEFGATQNLSKINNIIKRKNPYALFHSDGVQAYAKIPFEKINADMYSISGHKFYAPKGIGALMMRAKTRNSGGQSGGGQENGMRSGTLNTPGILSMEKALEYVCNFQEKSVDIMRQCKLRIAENLLKIDGARINGPEPQKGAAHIISVVLPGIRSQVLVQSLCKKGVLIGSGAACSAKKAEKNRVLEAIGVSPQDATATVRLSLCPENTVEQIDSACKVITKEVEMLRAFARK